MRGFVYDTVYVPRLTADGFGEAGQAMIVGKYLRRHARVEGVYHLADVVGAFKLAHGRIKNRLEGLLDVYSRRQDVSAQRVKRAIGLRIVPVVPIPLVLLILNRTRKAPVADVLEQELCNNGVALRRGRVEELRDSKPNLPALERFEVALIGTREPRLGRTGPPVVRAHGRPLERVSERWVHILPDCFISEEREERGVAHSREELLVLIHHELGVTVTTGLYGEYGFFCESGGRRFAFPVYHFAQYTLFVYERPRVELDGRIGDRHIDAAGRSQGAHAHRVRAILVAIENSLALQVEIIIRPTRPSRSCPTRPAGATRSSRTTGPARSSGTAGCRLCRRRNRR